MWGSHNKAAGVRASTATTLRCFQDLGYNCQSSFLKPEPETTADASELGYKPKGTLLFNLEIKETVDPTMKIQQ